MQRENRNKKVIPNLIWNLQRKVVSQRQQRQAWKTLNQVQGDDLVCYNYNKAFTLIELLVVVLIIGILAAVAVPQYQKAVWKSRNVQLKTLVQQVGQAQERYFLANGTFPKGLGEMDVEIPLTGIDTGSATYGGLCSYSVAGPDSLWQGKDFQLVINAGGVNAYWTVDPYKCAGFFKKIGQDMKCFGRKTQASTVEFCEKFEHGFNRTEGSTAFYDLP